MKYLINMVYGNGAKGKRMGDSQWLVMCSGFSQETLEEELYMSLLFPCE